MSRNYKFRNPKGVYFVSFAVVNWIDLLIREAYKEIILDSLKYCQKEKGFIIYAWVLMTSHIHLIVASEKNELSDIFRDFKRYTSRELKQAIQENPQESRKEWLLWMFERAGKKIPITNIGNYGNKTTIP